MNAFPTWLTDLPILGTLFHGSVGLVFFKIVGLLAASGVAVFLLRKFWVTGDGGGPSVKKLIKDGQFEEAGDACARVSNLPEALECYERGRAWAKAAHAARRLGKHTKAGALFEEAGELKLALASYEAANDGESISRLADHTSVPSHLTTAANWNNEAGRYSVAAELYRKAGKLRDAERCFASQGTEGVERAIDMYLEAFQEKTASGTPGKLARLYAGRAAILLAQQERFLEVIKVCKEAQINPKQLESEAPGLIKALAKLRKKRRSTPAPPAGGIALESPLASIGAEGQKRPSDVEDLNDDARYLDTPLSSPGALAASLATDEEPTNPEEAERPVRAYESNVPPPGDDLTIDAPLLSMDSLIDSEEGAAPLSAELDTDELSLSAPIQTEDEPVPAERHPAILPPAAERSSSSPPPSEHPPEVPPPPERFPSVSPPPRRRSSVPAVPEHHSSVPPAAEQKTSVPPPPAKFASVHPPQREDSSSLSIDEKREGLTPNMEETPLERLADSGSPASSSRGESDPAETTASESKAKADKVILGKIALTSRRSTKNGGLPQRPRRRPRSPGPNRRDVSIERDGSRDRDEQVGSEEEARSSRPTWDKDYAPPDVSEQMVQEKFEPYSDSDEEEYVVEPKGPPLPMRAPDEEDDEEPDVFISPSADSDLSVPIPWADTRELDFRDGGTDEGPPSKYETYEVDEEFEEENQVGGRKPLSTEDNVVEALLSVLEGKDSVEDLDDPARRDTPVVGNYQPPSPHGIMDPTDVDGEDGRDSFGFSKDVTNRYAILEQIGTGGMGEVYKARDLSLGRIVALKFLSPNMVGDDTAMRFFLREARAAAALNHPVIVTVFDIGILDKRPFIAMEFVDGTDLATRLAEEGALPEGHALNLIIQLALAMDYAHQRNVVHRDIKPPNVIETADGIIKILDFGLAKAIQGSPKKSTLVAGTPEYMSPEQLAGMEVDGRTDIFSLGVLLYEILTNRTPYDGALRSADFEPVSTHAPWLSPDIDIVLEKSLAIRPDDRFQTGREMAVSVRKLLRGS